MFGGVNGVRPSGSEDKQRLLDSELYSNSESVIQSAISQDSSSPFTTRKRTTVKSRGGVWGDTGGIRDDTNIDVPLPELDFNDPNFLELLREYEKDEREDQGGGAKELEVLRAQAHRKQGVGQGMAYVLLVGFIILFVVVINWYNGKQLERLKEEYGLGEERKVQPEFWWKRAAIYTIYVPSYHDSDGDGHGDLNGIRRHIDHLAYLGVDAVLLSSFLESPFDDFGRDVVDFKTIARKCGSVEDFDLLVKELRVHGIKVVVELVPNHTHRLHRWFSKSRMGNTAGNEKYKNYYVWHKGKILRNGTRVPPNNWVSVSGGPAWSYDEMRGEYYYHYYHHNLPDLNHRDQSVRQEIMDVFRYWLDRGADALYIDSLHSLYEVTDLELDEPQNSRSTAGPMDFSSLDHIYTEDQSDVHDYYGVWREFLENYSVTSGRRVGIIGDVLDDTVTDVIKYYFTGIDLPLCHALIDLKHDCGGRCTHELLDLWLVHIPQGHDAMWTLGGAERGRGTGRRDRLYQSVLNMLSLLLPGASVAYYGDEIGLPPLTLPPTHKAEEEEEEEEERLEHRSEEGERRERSKRGARGLMQWSAVDKRGSAAAAAAATAGGFSSESSINVEAQMADPSGRSVLEVFHRLTRLRKERSFLIGKLQFSLVNDNILSFMRFAKDGAPYLISLNLGNATSTDDYTLSSGVTYGKVVLAAVWDQPGDLMGEGIQPAGVLLGDRLSAESVVNGRSEGVQQGVVNGRSEGVQQGVVHERSEGVQQGELFEGMQQGEQFEGRREGGLNEVGLEDGRGGGRRGEYIREGEKVNLARLTLRPGEGVVVILLMDDVDFSNI